MNVRKDKGTREKNLAEEEMARAEETKMEAMAMCEKMTTDIERIANAEKTPEEEMLTEYLKSIDPWMKPIAITPEEDKREKLVYIHDFACSFDAVGNYGKKKRIAGVFEEHRPRFLKRLGIDPNAGFEMPSQDIMDNLPLLDGTEAMHYLSAKLEVDIIDTVIAERLKKAEAKIIYDMCQNEWTNEEAAEKEGKSLSTVKRARAHAKQAFADEAQLRFASGELTLRNNPWNYLRNLNVLSSGWRVI